MGVFMAVTDPVGVHRPAMDMDDDMRVKMGVAMKQRVEDNKGRPHRHCRERREKTGRDRLTQDRKGEDGPDKGGRCVVSARLSSP